MKVYVTWKYRKSPSATEGISSLMSDLSSCRDR